MNMKYKVNGDEDAILIEVPMSFIAHQEPKTKNTKGKNKVVEMIPETMYYLHTYTFEQRKQNWIINNKSRLDGSTIDYEYYHLETHKKLRSLIEVYRFVVYGKIPDKSKKSSENGETVQVTPRLKQHMHGANFIKHYVVGTCEYYNGDYKNIRRKVNLSERDIPLNFEIKGKRENADCYGHQQVNVGDDVLSTQVRSGDAAPSASVKSFYYLWDFELILEAHDAKLT